MLGLSPARGARALRRRSSTSPSSSEFVDLKLKNYSSGMLVRLAFAVMIQVDADILLIDEVLAVGDAAFQQKCFDEFDAMRDEGKTILLVTHDMGAVQRFCDRAMLLERGAIVDDRRARAVGDALPASSTSAASGADGDAARERRPSAAATARREIVEAWFEDEAGERADVAAARASACAFAARVRFTRARRRPALRRRAATTTARDAGVRGLERCGRRAHRAASRPATRSSFRVALRRTCFAPGRYYATPRSRATAAAIAWIDRRERIASVVVTGTRATGARRRPALRGRAASATGRRRVRRRVSAPPSRSAADQGPVARSAATRAASWHLTRTLAVTDFKLRFFGSALGYLWQLMRPLLLFGVLYVVFTQFVRLGSERRRYYPVALLLGHRAVHVLRRGDRRRGALARRPREPGAQDRVPAPGRPAGGRAHRARSTSR